jgi:hypothetical protein
VDDALLVRGLERFGELLGQLAGQVLRSSRAGRRALKHGSRGWAID